MRVGTLNDLAVKLEHEAEHTVRGGVLRAKVEGEVFDLLASLSRRQHCTRKKSELKKKTGRHSTATAGARGLLLLELNAVVGGLRGRVSLGGHRTTQEGLAHRTNGRCLALWFFCFLYT